MMFDLVRDLSSSSAFPSRKTLLEMDPRVVCMGLFYAICAVHILKNSEDTKDFAEDYAGKTIESDLKTWVSLKTDLAILLHAFLALKASDPSLTLSLDKIAEWFRYLLVDPKAKPSLLMKLDLGLGLDSPEFRVTRRHVANWKNCSDDDKNKVLNTIRWYFGTYIPTFDALRPVCGLITDDLSESNAGVTTSASTAVLPGGLGAGFDPDGDRGIYEKRPRKPLLLRR
jgi:hypothetical protein